jgi:uncharacterized delta-60 repeat protein
MKLKIRRRASIIEIRKASLLLFFVMSLIITATAQTNQVDPTFDPATSIDSEYLSPKTVVQSDGKILVFGFPRFNNVKGVSKNNIARLNADGSLDIGFVCDCEDFPYINSVFVQSDGKIFIGGGIAGASGQTVRRLNADGSRDFSFSAAFPNSVGGEVWAVLPDGRIYASNRQVLASFSSVTLYRLNPNGSIDQSFNYLSFNTSNSGRELLSILKVLPDGKLMIGGRHFYGFLFRVNTDGTKDTSFEAPALTVSPIPFNNVPYIYDFGFQSDGKIVVIGSFSSINGIGRTNFARLNANGSVDTQFSEAFYTTGRNLEILPDDKILTEPGINSSLSRLNPDGTEDSTFAATPSVKSWTLDLNGKIIIAANFLENDVTIKKIARLNADGTTDNLFSPAAVGVVGEVRKIALQPNGKILINGYFTQIGGTIRKEFARVNSDGTLDTTFNPEIGDGTIADITALADGKILVGGAFNRFGTTQQINLARLNADGSFDNTFTPIFGPENNSSVGRIAVQPDGKIIVTGNFATVNGTNRSGIARLNADGTTDVTFNATIGGIAYSLLIQADGKIIIAGSFSGVNGFNRSNLARLNADGGLDTSFNAGTISVLTQVKIQPDGKYLVLTGNFVLRRNADGSPDATLQSPNFASADRFVLQSDGNIVVVGSFTGVNSVTRKSIARIRSNGELDLLFYPNGANDAINDIVAQTDGKLIIGGKFSQIESIARSGIARLNTAAFARKTPFDFDGDGKADITVFRPSNSVWYQLLGSNYQFSATYFGTAGDIATPADFDGDGKTDIAIFRPSSGIWVYRSSANNSQNVITWGQNGDIPLPSDFNGDGKVDFIVYRPSSRTWYRYINGTSSQYSFVGFGAVGDKPVIGDFDGDGKSDPAVFRPSSGEWFYAASSQSGVHLRVAQWGLASDKLVPADYDGDGKTDAAIYRNGLWAIYNSSNGSNTILTFGQAGDIPVAADYDGDGKADVAVYRPSNGAWYLLRSTQGFSAITFGTNGDIPIPSAYVQ